jgi:hypothetical protein
VIVINACPCQPQSYVICLASLTLFSILYDVVSSSSAKVYVMDNLVVIPRYLFTISMVMSPLLFVVHRNGPGHCILGAIPEF